ncbi:MAG: virulence-associated E family protein, partial [Firmicutes bacterium]|nr:virulence-associated E family protein [Bacillota bacterium]
VNTSDLGRLHKFGAKDDDAAPGTPTVKLPSYEAMLDFATNDPAVKQTLGAERLESASEDFGALPEGSDTEWLKILAIGRNGDIKPTINNLLTILEKDPHLAGKIKHNDFSHRAVILKSVPWRKVKSEQDGELWRDSDDAGLRHYIETVYGINAPGKISDAVAVLLERQRFHPIRDYLNNLPEWDGIPRLEKLLIDYLGAEDSAYTRAVTRKTLVAAVARVMRPGCKFDNMLVQVGPQGLGKSQSISRLGGRWYSDSLNTVQGKEAYEQLQGAWIIEMGELTATRRADVEAIKHFISKQEDIFRVAYGRHVSKFPRQCIFIGTTNDPEFLRDKTGNRRFWPVDVGIWERKKSLWIDMDHYVIDQIWAEATDAWRNGERLYLEAALETEAIQRQEQHTEASTKAGLVQEYLERLLPTDWENRDISSRRAYLHGGDFGTEVEGIVRRERVCAMEVWVELFCGDPKLMTPIQAREINDILRRVPGWKTYTESRGRLKFGKIYGLQRAFVRM